MLEIGLFHNGASSLPIATTKDGVTFNKGSLQEVRLDARGQADLDPIIVTKGDARSSFMLSRSRRDTPSRSLTLPLLCGSVVGCLCARATNAARLLGRHKAAQETLVNQVRQGILAEKLGFQSFWLTEHHFQPEGAEMSCAAAASAASDLRHR